MSIWDTLGIKPTNDITEIKKAYASKAKEVHPETDPVKFNELHRAYQMAQSYARSSYETVYSTSDVDSWSKVESTSNKSIGEYSFAFEEVGKAEAEIFQLIEQIIYYKSTKKERSEYVQKLFGYEKLFDYLVAHEKMREKFSAVLELECLRTKDIKRIKKAFDKYFETKLPESLQAIDSLLNAPKRGYGRWFFILPYLAFLMALMCPNYILYYKTDDIQAVFAFTLFVLIIIWAVVMFFQRTRANEVERSLPSSIEQRIGVGTFILGLFSGGSWLMSTCCFFILPSLEDGFSLVENIFGTSLTVFVPNNSIAIVTLIACLFGYLCHSMSISSARTDAQMDYWKNNYQ